MIIPLLLGLGVLTAVALSKRPTGRFIGDEAQIGDQVTFNLGQTTLSPEVQALQGLIQGRNIVLVVTEMAADTLTGYIEVQNGMRLFGPVTISRSSVTGVYRNSQLVS